MSKLIEKLEISEDYNRGFKDGLVQGHLDKSIIGKWDIKNYIPYCSICNESSIKRSKYCPNCGARLFIDDKKEI